MPLNIFSAAKEFEPYKNKVDVELAVPVVVMVLSSWIVYETPFIVYTFPLHVPDVLLALSDSRSKDSLFFAPFSPITFIKV